MLHLRATLVLSSLVVLSLACGGGPPPAAVPEVIHPAGEAVTSGDLEFTVHSSSRRSRVGGSYVNHQAPEGAELQLVDVSARNLGDKPLAMVGRFQLRLGEQLYTPSTPCQIATKNSWNLLEAVNPGITHRGQVCFEVPADAGPMLFGAKSGLLVEPVLFQLDER